MLGNAPSLKKKTGLRADHTSSEYPRTSAALNHRSAARLEPQRPAVVALMTTWWSRCCDKDNCRET